MVAHNRVIQTENRTITEFIAMMAGGKFLIPSFQRYFVWDAGKIINLWDSIFHFYPIGSILYWRTYVHLHVHRRLGGYIIPGDNGAGHSLHSYILDGQQRATSLFVSFYGGKGLVKDRDAFDYTLYFDAQNGTFFFEDDLYRRKWSVNPAFLIRLKDIDGLGADPFRHIADAPGFHVEAERNLEQLQYALNNYSIPFIRLDGFGIKEVCDVFERINQGGQRLENLDIYIARTFGNNPTVIEEDM